MIMPIMSLLFLAAQGGSCRHNKDIARLVADLKGVDDEKLNKREKLHRKAVIEWASEEKLDACRTWEEILLQYPRDSMALLFTYYGYIVSGQSRMLRDVVARVLPWWRESDFHYGYLQGYYAFGLEQTNMFDAAERAVKKSLQINKNNAWAMHAYSHLFDATCRSQEGVDFLQVNDVFLEEKNSLSCHLHWHQTVNLTELGRYENVLDIYDNKILPAFKKSGSPFNINDGVQVLQRLEFEGHNVGDRWEELYAAYKPMSGYHELIYDDLHLIAALVRSKAGRENKSHFIESLEAYAKRSIGSNGGITKNIGVDFAKGVAAYGEGSFEEASDLLFPLYKETWQLGGSNAQRDLFNLFVINSCMRSPQQSHRTIARSLLHERQLYRPDSLLTDRVFARLDQDH